MHDIDYLSVHMRHNHQYRHVACFRTMKGTSFPLCGRMTASGPQPSSNQPVSDRHGPGPARSRATACLFYYLIQSFSHRDCQDRKYDRRLSHPAYSNISSCTPSIAARIPLWYVVCTVLFHSRYDMYHHQSLPLLRTVFLSYILYTAKSVCAKSHAISMPSDRQIPICHLRLRSTDCCARSCGSCLVKYAPDPYSSCSAKSNCPYAYNLSRFFLSSTAQTLPRCPASVAHLACGAVQIENGRSHAVAAGCIKVAALVNFCRTLAKPTSSLFLAQGKRYSLLHLPHESHLVRLSNHIPSQIAQCLRHPLLHFSRRRAPRNSAEYNLHRLQAGLR